MPGPQRTDRNRRISVQAEAFTASCERVVETAAKMEDEALTQRDFHCVYRPLHRETHGAENVPLSKARGNQSEGLDL
jgi:hypothetical protein